jgi:cobalt-zinc-cadmium efflux system protein
MVVEIVGGIVSGSLALLGDAAHMATDCAAYGIALYAARVAMRPPNKRRTWGHERAEILAALFNGATLIAASAWIVIEGVRRLIDPVAVTGGAVIVVATAGLIANLGIVWVLWKHAGSGLNARAALLHGIADALSSVLVIVAGLVVTLTGFERADALASFGIAALVLHGSWRLVREAADVLLESVPGGLELDEVAAVLLAHDDVTEVHDLHLWTVAHEQVALSAHVRVTGACDRDALVQQLQGRLLSTCGIQHATLQVTADRGASPLQTVSAMDVTEAVTWATDHIAAAHPELSRAVISAAAGAAVVGHRPGERVSPVQVSARAMAILRSPDEGNQT